MKVSNRANVGEDGDPSDEYIDGDDHTGTVTVAEDHDEVTITVSNPVLSAGADNLNLNFTLFSKFPITREMVTNVNVITFNENENYVLEDFEEQINQEPAEPVTIKFDDWQSTDSWKMKRHCDKNILDILVDPYIEEDPNRLNNQDDENVGGNPYGKHELKKGENAPSSVCEIVQLLIFWQYLKKVADDSTFVIVSAKEKLFIFTFSADENLVNLRDKVVAMNDRIRIPDEYKLKNLATGRSIYSEKFASTKCSELASGQKNKNKFVPPRNIKWVSFE